MRNSLALLGLLLLASFAASAKDKGPSAEEILKKASDSTDVWSQGPLMVTAKVRFLQMRDGPVDMDYTLYWQPPYRWRSEWQGGGISDVRAMIGSLAWTKSNIQVPALRMLQFDDAMQKLSSDLLSSPFVSEPPPMNPPKYDVRNRKISGKAAHCLGFRGEELKVCFDAESGIPLIYASTFETAYYSDYVAFDGKWFPSSIKLQENGEAVLEAKLKIKPWTVDATLWRAPEGVVASELPQCGDEKAPVRGGKSIHLERPEYPTLARNARQQGRVVLYATLGKDGRIKNLVLLQSAGEMLDQAAYKAVRNWAYEPSLRCGVPIEMEFPITVNFTLAR